MFKVKSIDKETIDGWQIAESGLTARAVNACTAEGIATIGTLREYNENDLGKIIGMGNQSVQAIVRFLHTCDQIQAGNKLFDDLRSTFAFLLSQSQYDTLALRYRLHTDENNIETLEKIGRKHEVTRERVRQVEEKARKILSSQLAQACLSSIYELFEDIIGNNNMVAMDENISASSTQPMTAGYNNSNLLHLLCDCSTRITFHNNFYSLLSPETIKDIENKAIKLLSSAITPVSLNTILDTLSSSRPPSPTTIHRDTLVCILRHHPDILSTIDDRYLTGETGISAFIKEIMQKMPQPVHFRLINHEFNKTVQPVNRKGPGFILDILSSNQQFRKISSGNYELAIKA